MTKRTDIHAASSPSFDPESYELFGVFDLVKKVVVLDESVPVSGAWGAIWIDKKHTEPSPFAIALEKLEEAGWNTDIVLNSRGEERDTAHSRNCAHCGQSIKYGGLLTHEQDMTLIVVGEDCLQNRFLSDLTKAQFQTIREQARLNRERSTKREKIGSILEAHPELEQAVESKNTFVSDVMSKLLKNGKLSDRQIEAVKTALVRDAQREADKVKRDEADALAALTASPAPEGRITIEGEVLSAKYQSSGYGFTALKALIRTTDGWKLWTTLPAQIDLEPRQARGHVVKMVVSVTPSPDDKLFAFGKRPSKGEIVSTPEVA